MKRKSLRLNMLLNALKGLSGILFPLISFRYIARVLGVENIGIYDFSSSAVSYAMLLAALGIKTYAVREGAKKRDRRKELEAFAGEIFTLNCWTTLLSYALLGMTLLCVDRFRRHADIILILSVQIVFQTIGVEWLCTIYEDYLFMTVRSIVTHTVSVILLFVLVKSAEDLPVYTAITVFSNAAANGMNYLHARKYCRLRLTRRIAWRRHLGPVLVLFATQLAITVYTNSDKLILGFLWNEETVGIYSVSTKVYGIIRTLLSSVIIVSIPRLSAELGKEGQGRFLKTLREVYETLLTVMIPALVGVALLSREIILIVAGEEYLAACGSLILLCGAMLFSLGAWFWGQSVLVPLGREGYVFRITVWSAVINILGNLILIPRGKEAAAALTTLLAEGFAFYMQRREGTKNAALPGMGKLIAKIAAGCVLVSGAVLLCSMIGNLWLRTVCSVTLAAAAYFCVECALRNQAALDIGGSLKKRLWKGGGKGEKPAS